MAEILRKRTIRPSSRLTTSKTYKVDTKGVSHSDTLLVHIDHESNPFHRTYTFNGTDVANKNSIRFRVTESGNTIDITWSGAAPINAPVKTVLGAKSRTSIEPMKTVTQTALTRQKTSLPPLSDSETTILVLGSLPGSKSLQVQEYYANTTNRFWPIISRVTNNPIPTTYNAKKQLLRKTKIGVWDVVRNAIRVGSLDHAIENETPNDLESFIATHSNLKVIAFNGQKAEVFFDKYFERKSGLKYISLPSTSSANTRLSLEQMCEAWRTIMRP